MEKSLLTILLKRLASGDHSALPAACARLANRLVFVPASSSGAGPEVRYGPTKVAVPDGRLAVPLFTSERNWKGWAVRNGCRDSDVLSVLGADFCAALDVHTPVLVDPETDYEVLLEPEAIDEIASAPVDESSFESETAPEPRVPAAAAGLQPVRTSPTELMVRPRPKGLVETPDEAISNFRKSGPSRSSSQIILSRSAGQGGATSDLTDQKGKSFLNFLKSAKA